MARDTRDTPDERRGTPSTTRLFGIDAGRGRWILILACFPINVCLGSVYAYSVFRNPIQSLFQSSAIESTLPFTVFLVFDTVLMFFGGRLIDLFGPRRVGVIGGVLVGTGWILSGVLPRMIPSIWTLVLTYGLVGGSGVGLAYGVPLAVATRWIPERKGLAVGLTLAGFGGSPLITANLARPLIESHGLAYTFIVMGAAFLVIVVGLSFTLRFPPATWRPRTGDLAATSALVRHDFEPSRMVRTSTFWGLFLTYTIGGLAGLMAIGISSPVGTDVVRLDTATAATMVGVFALFNGAGRPVWGWLTDRITPRWTATVSMLAILCASLLMLGAGEGTVILYTVAFAMLWMCFGGWLAIAPTATATFFGVKNYARNYSYVYLAYGLAAVLGNVLSGSSLDLFGNYDVAFMTTAVLAIVGAVAALALMRPPS